jgi:hypothetical protein
VKVLWNAVTSEFNCCSEHTILSSAGFTYVSELDLANLAKGADDFSTDFVGNI